MPFTPYHFGPGTLVKAAVPKYFSLLIFVAAQVLMDTEPLYYMMQNDPHIHRTFHTYLGCHIVIAALMFIVRPVLSWILKKPFPFGVTLISAMAGAYSHVFLDSLMHADQVPLAPFVKGNPFRNAVSLEHLYLFCVVTGILGLMILGIQQWRQSCRKTN